MRMIVTRPQHDITTKYLSVWAGEIVDFAKQKGVEVCDLFREKANRVEFEGRIKKIEPDVVFLNGHGNDDCVTGHDNIDLVNVYDNCAILNDKITYALSCNSAKNLGQKVAESGRATYIGYRDEFAFVSDRNYLHRPVDDPRAKPFMEASNQVMISLLKGGRAGEAAERSKNKFKESYLKLSASTADPDSVLAAQLLWWNMRNQACLGDAEARLF